MDQTNILMDRFIIGLIAGAVIAFIVYDRFLASEPEVITEYIERTETDTSYTKKSERVEFDSTVVESLEDSVDHYRSLYEKELSNVKIITEKEFQEKPFEAPLRRYRSMKAFTFGDVHYNALVAGILVDMSINADYRIPTVTHTITKEKNQTIIKRPGGLFATGGISNDFHFSVGGLYVKDRTVIGYSHQPSSVTDKHRIYVGWKVFGN